MRLLHRIGNQPLIRTFRGLNPQSKVIVGTEPMWSIPFNLFIPFAAVYRAALGLSDRQIGLIASITMCVSVVAGLLSGAITDKLGRRWTTFLSDILGWATPCLIWAFSQNFWWFAAAAFFNGMWQVSNTSWTCLMVENVEKTQIVNVWQIIYLLGQLVVLFAPLSGLMVRSAGVVRTMRVLYMFAVVSMMIKFVIVFIYGGETEQGRIRMAETKHTPLRKLLSGYGGVLKSILRSKELVLVLALSVLLTIVTTAVSMFFGLYATQNMGLPQESLAFLPILRAVIMLFFYFFLTQRLDRLPLRVPMVLGLLLYIASQALLILSGHLGGTQAAYPRIIMYVVLEAFGFAMVLPRKDSLMTLFIHPHERARMTCIMNALVTVVAMPFGYIAGWLSGMERRLPFGMALAALALALVLVIFLKVSVRDEEGEGKKVG